MGLQIALGIEDGDRTHIRLIQHLIENALEPLAVPLRHGRGRQRRELLGDQLAARIELMAHLRQLHPGEIDAKRYG